MAPLGPLLALWIGLLTSSPQGAADAPGAGPAAPDAPAAQDPAGRASDPVRVRWLDPPTAVALHEPFELALEIELAPAALEGGLLRLLNRPLDLDLAVGGAWFEGPQTLVTLERTAPRGPTVVLGDAVGALEPRPGSDGRVFEVSALLAATAPGRLELPTPTVRYATSDRFDVDWLGRRRAVGRDERFARAVPLGIDVRDWPTGAAPPGFVGAIGAFESSSQVRPRDLEVGDELELSVRLDGRGGLHEPGPPDRLDLEGFSDLGRRTQVDRGPDARLELETVYRLRAERAGAFDLAPRPWSWLAPGGTRFVTADVDPVPIVVRLPPGLAPSGASVAGAASGTRPGAAGPAGDDPSGFSPRSLLPVLRLVGAGLAVVVLGWVVARAGRAALVAGRRPRTPDRDEGLDRLAAGCRAAAEAEDLEALETSWRALLARRTGHAERSLTGADAFPALTGRGLDASTARAAADQLDALGRARFGGAPVPIDPARIQELAAALCDPRHFPRD